jgi:hypothetical protein
VKKPLPARIDRLEAARGPLPMAEAAELAALEREYAARFPLPMSAWSSERCDDFLAYEASAAAGRMDELRERAKPAAQRAAEAADRILIASLSPDQLDEYMAALLAANSEKPPCQS